MDEASTTTHNSLHSLFKTFNSSELCEWQEEPSNEDNFVLRTTEDGSVELAKSSLNKCIEYLTNEPEDKTLKQTFFYTYRAFSNDEEVFIKLLQRYGYVSDPLLQIRVATFVQEWVEFSLCDFTEGFIEKILFFAEHVLTENGHNDLSSSIKQSIIGSKGRRLERDLFTPFVFDADFRFENYASSLIAETLTWIDFHMFSRIRPFELSEIKWQGPDRHKESPNVCSVISRFNMLSLWVSSTIVSKENLQERADSIVKLLEVLDCLLGLNNFTSLFAIFAGLNSVSVFRLKQTYKLIPERSKEIFIKISTLTNSKGVYRNYREYIETVTGPCIPYYGVALTSIIFCCEGSTSLTAENRINFSGFKIVASIAKKLLEYQKASYSIEPDITLKEKLLFLPFMSESDQYTLSLLREPRRT
eukprot:TRINITY_DN4853_c0_g2_i2.p1 TRINITY_DN4853_c0_g2~~TRINITY_DN4853_c0_g2_i2.p1  ORF type:complete len:416 (-),score=57.96 TRINITY_DN4853_c0_g2_i2:99-1346(-)